jgi:carboxypeptidase T
MKRPAVFTLLGLGALIVALAIAVRPAPAGEHPVFNYEDVVVRAYFDDPQMVWDLATWNEPWEVHYDKGFVVVEVSVAEYALLERAGFRLEIDQELTEELNRPLTYLPGQLSGIPGYPCYRTVEETYATAESLAATYPHLATWTVIGESWEKQTGFGGYDLKVLRLTNNNVEGEKPKIFIMAALHAREYTTAELVTRMAEYLVYNYGVDPDATWLLDHHEFLLLLQANPDGRKRAEAGLSWRKNTNNNYCSNTNNRGADLNRNFEFMWGCCGGSSGSQCDITYRGPSAGSEPEVQAVQDYVRAEFPDQRDDPIGAGAPITATGVFLDIHSYSQLVLWPWGFTSTPTANATAFQTLGRKLAYFNNYKPEQAIGLYPTDGTTDDFAYGELGLAAYTYELGTSFFQQCSAFENTILPDNLPSLLYAGKVARTPYMTPAGPDALNLQVQPAAVAAGESLLLTALLDDTRYNHTYGAEPVQNIAAAEFYINTPPWITTTTPVALPMAPADGAFNSPIETAQGVVETTDLEPGRHTLFVRGQDTAGNWGAFTAQFFYVVDPAVSPILAGQTIAGDTGLPLEATISATGPFLTTSDPDTGLYQMQVVSGVYDMAAVPFSPDYAPQAVTGVVASDYQTVQQNFTFCPYETFFFDDVESGNLGWTAQAPWAITTEKSYSPSQSWTDSPGGNYANNLNVSLTSPLFDLSEYEGISLAYWQVCNTEAGYDFCRVEVSTNGGASWTEVARYHGLNTQWQYIELPVPMLDNQPNVRIRFRFTSDGSVIADGWHVDDIRLRGATTTCSPPLVAPGASFDSSSPDILGEPTQFTNLSTGTDLTFAWDFGDGSPIGAAPNPAHTYGAPGSYTVILTATNDLGSDSAIGIVDIQELPEAAFTSAGWTAVGDATQFTNASTGTDLTYTWEFGDDSPLSHEEHPLHTYEEAGSYTVTLTASNMVGSDVYMAVVHVLVAPGASFSATTPVALGDAVAFTNTSTGTDLTYTWDFGDESPLSHEEHPLHTYEEAGSYTVTLTASNMVGSDVYTAVVVVTEDDPEPAPPFKQYLPLILSSEEAPAATPARWLRSRR